MALLSSPLALMAQSMKVPCSKSTKLYEPKIKTIKNNDGWFIKQRRS